MMMRKNLTSAAVATAILLLGSLVAPTAVVAQTTVSLTVASAYADGAAPPVMWSTIRQDGALVTSGFTPLTADILPGVEYTVYLADYQDITLHHWEDTGEFSRPRPVTISADTTFTGVYISNAHPLPDEEPAPEPDPDFTPLTHMSDTTQSYGVLVSGSAFSGNHQIAAELANSNSVLVGKQIDEVTIMLQRVGAPTGNAQVAVFDANQNVKQLFADVDVTTIPTSMGEMTFSIPGLYTIEAGDRIGLRFTGGSSSSGVSVMMDKVTSDSLFDGQNSQRVRGTSNTGWLTYDTNEDLYMVLRQTKDDGSGSSGNEPPIVQPVSASVQENDISGVAITLQGSDPDGDTLIYYPVTQATKGTLSLVDGNVIHYTPYDWQDGSDSFQYVASDGTNESAPATASIDIENTGSKTTSKVVVISEYEDGISTSGYSTTLSQGGTTINSGFTHVDFQVNNGENYVVTVSNGGGAFVRWDDGSTNTSRTLNISEDTAITAIYRRS